MEPITGETSQGSATLARPVRGVDVEAPWRWLRLGWQDLVRARNVSLSFGVLIALASVLLINTLWRIDLLPYALPLAAGFMFVAPALGICFYDISRRLERNEPVTFGSVRARLEAPCRQIARHGPGDDAVPAGLDPLRPPCCSRCSSDRTRQAGIASSRRCYFRPTACRS